MEKAVRKSGKRHPPRNSKEQMDTQREGIDQGRRERDEINERESLNAKEGNVHFCHLFCSPP